MQRWLPLVLFALILGCAPIVSLIAPDHLGNLQPFGALFFCGMACFGARWIWVPAVAWLVSSFVTSALHGYGISPQILVTIIGFAAIVGLGKIFQGKGVGALFVGSLSAAVAFYFLTNTLSWAFEPLYEKSLRGYAQALWTGIGVPEFPPTWHFFRNSLVAQSVFTAAFLGAFGYLSAPRFQALSRERV